MSLDEREVLQQPTQRQRRRAEGRLKSGFIEAVHLPAKRCSQPVERTEEVLHLGGGDRGLPRCVVITHSIKVFGTSDVRPPTPEAFGRGLPQTAGSGTRYGAFCSTPSDGSDGSSGTRCVAIEVEAIQSHLGHRSITTTLDRYGHLFEDEHEKLAERIDAAYASIASPTDP